MNPIALPIAAITIGKRERPAYAPKVAALADRIAQCAAEGIGHDGLRVPVEVMGKDDGYRLISGLHRLRAVEQVGYSEIAAVVLDVTEVVALRLQLEENLVRADLTALDEALFVKRYRELYEAEHGEVKAGRPWPNNRDNLSPLNHVERDKLSLWSEAASKLLGRHPKAIQRALRIANGLHADTRDMLRGTDWENNQKALLELAGVPAERQKAVLDILFDEGVGCTSMREAIAMALGTEERPDKRQNVDKWLDLYRAKDVVRQEVYRAGFVRDLTGLRRAAAAEGFEIVPVGPAARGDK